MHCEEYIIHLGARHCSRHRKYSCECSCFLLYGSIMSLAYVFHWCYWKTCIPIWRGWTHSTTRKQYETGLGNRKGLIFKETIIRHPKNFLWPRKYLWTNKIRLQLKVFICTFFHSLKSWSLFMLKYPRNSSLTVTMFVPFHCNSILSMTENQMAHNQRVKISASEGFQDSV